MDDVWNREEGLGDKSEEGTGPASASPTGAGSTGAGQARGPEIGAAGVGGEGGNAGEVDLGVVGDAPDTMEALGEWSGRLRERVQPEDQPR